MDAATFWSAIGAIGSCVGAYYAYRAIRSKEATPLPSHTPASLAEPPSPLSRQPGAVRTPSGQSSPPPAPPRRLPGKGRSNGWAAEMELVKRLNRLMGRRWDYGNGSKKAPEHYWRLGESDGQDVLAAATRE